MKKLKSFFKILFNLWVICLVVLCVGVFFMWLNPHDLPVKIVLLLMLFGVCSMVFWIGCGGQQDGKALLIITFTIVFLVVSFSIPNYSGEIVVLNNGQELLAKPNFVMLQKFKLLPTSIKTQVDLLYLEPPDIKNILDLHRKNVIFTGTVICLPRGGIYEKYQTMMLLLYLEPRVKHEMQKIVLEHETDKKFWTGPKEIPIPEDSFLKNYDVVLLLTTP